MKGARREKDREGRRRRASRLAPRHDRPGDPDPGGLVRIQPSRDRRLPCRASFSGASASGNFSRISISEREAPPEGKGEAPKSGTWKRADSVEAFLHALGPVPSSRPGWRTTGTGETVVGIAVEGQGRPPSPGGRAGARRAGPLRPRATIYLHDGKALYRRDTGRRRGKTRGSSTRRCGVLLEPERDPLLPEAARALPPRVPPPRRKGSPRRTLRRTGATATLALWEGAKERLAGGGPARRIPGGSTCRSFPVLHRIEEKGIRIVPGSRGAFEGARPRHLRHRAEGGGRPPGTDFTSTRRSKLAFLSSRSWASSRQEDQTGLLHRP